MGKNRFVGGGSDGGMQSHQPSLDDERLLDDVLEDGTSYVVVRGRKWSVKYKRYRHLRNMSHVLLNDKGEEGAIVCKCVAALRLNWWCYWLFGWILWRWYYYVREYRNDELMPYIAECKKKVQAEEYWASIMLLTAMKDTMMMMTREEVNRFQAEHLTEQLGALEKSAES